MRRNIKADVCVCVSLCVRQRAATYLPDIRHALPPSVFQEHWPCFVLPTPPPTTPPKRTIYRRLTRLPASQCFLARGDSFCVCVCVLPG